MKVDTRHGLKRHRTWIRYDIPDMLNDDHSGTDEDNADIFADAVSLNETYSKVRIQKN
jgi:hypothetical protein